MKCFYNTNFSCKNYPVLHTVYHFPFEFVVLPEDEAYDSRRREMLYLDELERINHRFGMYAMLDIKAPLKVSR